ncbi:DUF6314 family protein [Modicisalibacter ilicicola]|uniref:DUF6314 family protein n=1 Tax=Modicisalibacter ilicicola TaxID=480814 RepID=UPI0009FBFE52|nr:DUF6314 family protein [Halomonas ilicicola]
MSSISCVTFRSRSGAGSRCGWSGKGQGRVEARCHEDGSLTFTETGHFQQDALPEPSGISSARPLPFHNVFRWRSHAEHVALSHERRGVDAAVWLFDLVVAEDERDADFVSREAHLCGDDRYRATLTFTEDGFDLEWTIHGPRKDEHLHYRYR